MIIFNNKLNIQIYNLHYNFNIDLINLDSVSIISENVIWVRDEFKESLLFSNYSKMNLPDNYNLEKNKGKYFYKKKK